MSYTIISMYRYYLFPKSKLEIRFNTRQFILFEGNDLLQISVQGNDITVSNDHIIIGKNIELINSGRECLEVCGIIFESSNSSNLAKDIYIVSKQAANSTMYLFNNEITKCPSLNALAEKQLKDLCEMIFAKARTLDAVQPEKYIQALNERLDKRLIMVHRYIRMHYYQPLTLNDLAELIKSNPVYLSNMFSKVFHISPIKYLQKIRMRKASELLLSTDMSIREISQALGYISNSQFSNIFKQYYGCTPREFRRYDYFKLSEPSQTENSPRLR